MSIQVEIMGRVAEGRLVALGLAMPGSPEKRRTFAVPSVIEMLDGWLGGCLHRRT
jgi:hypothetical protein